MYDPTLTWMQTCQEVNSVLKNVSKPVQEEFRKARVHFLCAGKKHNGGHMSGLGGGRPMGGGRGRGSMSGMRGMGGGNGPTSMGGPARNSMGGGRGGGFNRPGGFGGAGNNVQPGNFGGFSQPGGQPSYPAQPQQPIAQPDNTITF